MSEEQAQNGFSLNIQEISRELRIRPEIYQRLLSSFSKTIMEKLQTLDEALKSDDVMKVRAILHELKGTSGNLRLKDVSDAANTLHVSVKAGEAKEKLSEEFEVLKGKADLFVDYVAKLIPAE